MALGLIPQVVFDITTEDRDGDQARNSIIYPFDAGNPISLVSAVAYGTAVASTQGAISNGLIRKASIRFELVDAALDNAIPDAASEVERKGMFTFALANRQSAKIEVPSFTPALLMPGTDEINTANPFVAAFLTLILNGPPGAGNGAQTAGGANYVRLRRAYKYIRKSVKNVG